MQFLQDIIAYLDAHQSEFYALSDQVWSTPELFFREEKSAAALEQFLEDRGFAVERGVANVPTAFTASYGSGRPVVAVLGEFDALPELSQEAACAQKAPVVDGAPGHGCGHNALGAGSAAAAVAIAEMIRTHSVSGTVRYYGCPAEESGAGKEFLIEAGLLDDVDFALTWHPDTKNCVLSLGQLAIQGLRFYFTGKSAHAAGSPELGRSALDACELMNVGVNYLREHVPQEARMHYAYLDVGGAAPNVVQSHACLKYFIRAPKMETMLDISKRVQDIARGAALMTGTQLRIETEFGMCDYMGNDVLSRVMGRALEQVGGPQFDDADRALAETFTSQYTETQLRNDLDDLQKYLTAEEDPGQYVDGPLFQKTIPYRKSAYIKAGSTDVGNVSHKVPTAWVNTAGCAFGTPYHSWYATAQAGSSIMHKALLCAAKVIAVTAVEVMDSPETLAAAKEEYQKNTGGVYVSPMAGAPLKMWF